MSPSLLQTSYVNISELINNKELSDLYMLEWGRRMMVLFGYINPENRIPNKKTLCDINGKELFEACKSAYPDCFMHVQTVLSEKNGEEMAGFYFILKRDLIISYENNPEFNDSASIIHSRSENEEIIRSLVELINNCRKVKKDAKHFYLLTNPQYGLDLKMIEIPESKLDLKTHYNDDFQEVHSYIEKNVKSEKRSGKIVLLNGLFGTGKTFYIRHLISNLNLDFIYLTPSMASHLDQPVFCDLLSDNEHEKAIVIEDAELLIGKRNESNGSLVSAILNFSDGIIGDALKVKLIIITCNSRLGEIDQAILRKGRLLINYEFGKLERSKAQALSDKLGYSSLITEDTSLADIYNQEMKGIAERTERIGFRN